MFGSQNSPQDLGPVDRRGGATFSETDMAEERFEGWFIVELMGHRRLAGFVQQVEIAGAPMLRLDVPSPCTGVSANWCPICGD